MDAELEFAIQPNTTGKQLFDQVGLCELERENSHLEKKLLQHLNHFVCEAYSLGCCLLLSVEQPISPPVGLTLRTLWGWPCSQLRGALSGTSKASSAPPGCQACRCLRGGSTPHPLPQFCRTHSSGCPLPPALVVTWLLLAISVGLGAVEIRDRPRAREGPGRRGSRVTLPSSFGRSSLRRSSELGPTEPVAFPLAA